MIQDVEFSAESFVTGNHTVYFLCFSWPNYLFFPGCVFILRLNLIHPAVRTRWMWRKFSEDLGSCVAKKNHTYLLFSAVRSSEITYLLRKRLKVLSTEIQINHLISVGVESEAGVKCWNKVVVWPLERPIWLSCDCESCLKRLDEK